MAKYQKLFPSRFTTLNWARRGDEVCSVNMHQLSNLGWIGLKGHIQDCGGTVVFCIVVVGCEYSLYSHNEHIVTESSYIWRQVHT